MLPNGVYGKAKQQEIFATSASGENTDAYTLTLFAEELCGDGRRLEAVSIYQEAALLYKALEGDKGWNGITNCIAGLCAVCDCAATKQAGNEDLLRSVVNAMRRIIREIRSFGSFSNEAKFLKEAEFLVEIARAKLYLSHPGDAISSLEDVLLFVKEKFPRDFKKQEMYGTVLYWLGATNKLISNYKQSTGYLQQAFEAFATAVDFENQELQWKANFNKCVEMLGGSEFTNSSSDILFLLRDDSKLILFYYFAYVFVSDARSIHATLARTGAGKHRTAEIVTGLCGIKAKLVQS